MLGLLANFVISATQILPLGQHWCCDMGIDKREINKEATA